MNEYLKLALSQIPRYFMDLMDVTIGPKAFLLKRCLPGEEAVNKAFIFFGMTLLVAAVIQIPSMPRKDNLFVQFAVSTASVGLIQLATILILRLAWKIVGGKAELRELFMCTAYVSAPMLFLVIAFALVGDVLFQVTDPEGHAAMLANPAATLPDASIERGGLELQLIFIAAGLAVAYLWFLGAWGAYRVLNAVSKFRSLVAFLLYNLFSVPLWILALFMAVHQARA